MGLGRQLTHLDVPNLVPGTEGSMAQGEKPLRSLERLGSLGKWSSGVGGPGKPTLSLLHA